MSMTRPHSTLIIRIPLELKARIDADLRADPYGFEKHGRYTGRRSINSETVKALEVAFTDQALKAETALVEAVLAKGKKKLSSGHRTTIRGKKQRTVSGPQLKLKLKSKRKAARS